MDEGTKKRIAMNEATYRKINEAIRADLPDGRIAFVCECGRLGCNRLLHRSRAEYEAVREDSRRFAIVPGHEITEVEDVVAQHAHYAVIQKRAETWDVAGRIDPRRPLE